MAEPAPIYEPEDEQPVTRPDLHTIEGGGETSEPRRGHLSVAGKEKTKSPEELEDDEKGGGFYKPDQAESEEQGKLGAAERQIGGGLKKEENKLIKLANYFTGLSTNKKLLMGGGGALGIVSIFIFIFLTLLPLKINHIVNNLQSRFFASSEQAVSRRTDYLFSAYIKRHVLPSFNNCPGVGSSRTITKDCIAPIEGETPAAKLFRGWREARLENKLAENYGIEFERKAGGGFVLRSRGIPDVDIDPSFTSDGRELGDLGRNEFRQRYKAALNNALEGETKWKRVMYRIKVGRLLERKYGIRRCLFACKVTDNFNDWGDNKKNAFQKKMVKRVVIPHTDHAGVALLCILSSGCGDPTPDGEDNGRRTKLEKDITVLLERTGKEAVTDSVKQIADAVETIEKDGGFTRYLIKRVVAKAMGDQAADYATGAIPVVGWLDRIASLTSALGNVGPNVKRVVFFVNSAAMVNFYSLYRSHADELKNGNIDAALLGSAISSLGDNEQYLGDGDQSIRDRADQPAELSPLYSEVMGTSAGQQTSLFNIFSPTAYAQANETAGSKKQYTCDNGQPIASDKTICKEESLAANNILTSISDLFDSGPLQILKQMADKYVDLRNSIIGPILNVIGRLISLVPGADSVIASFSSVIESFLKNVVNYIIPSPISDKNSGARAFNMMAGGANVAGNEYAQYGTGAALISDQQAAQIRYEQENKARSEFANRPLFARMFDSENPYSLVSRVAISLPSETSNLSQSSFASLVSNPLNKLASALGTMFSGSRAAYAQFAEDPFGIPQFGWDINNSVFTENPDIYTPEYCAQINKDWQAGTGQFTGTLGQDEDTGSDVHTAPNPCLLEEAAAGSAGGLYTDEVFPAKDLRDAGEDNSAPANTGGGNTGGNGTASSCTLSRDKMVEQILGHQGGLLRLQSPNAQTENLQNPNRTTDRLVCLLWSVLEQGKFKVGIGSIRRDGDGNSLHGQGRAIDFGSAGTDDMPGLFKWLYDNKETLAIDELIFDPVPAGSHLVDQGNNCDTCYDQATLNAHRDHVHAGVLP
jgi:hypothetical protein